MLTKELEKGVSKTFRNLKDEHCRDLKINYILNAMLHYYNILDHNFDIKNASQIKNTIYPDNALNVP